MAPHRSIIGRDEMANTYCDICKCWHRPDGSRADGEEDAPVPTTSENQKSKETEDDF